MQLHRAGATITRSNALVSECAPRTHRPSPRASDGLQCHAVATTRDFLGARTSSAEMDLDNDYCNISTPYSPEYVRARTIQTPGDVLQVMGRIVKITVSLGTFFGSLWLDGVIGRADTPDVVRQRAAQLRDTLTYLGPSFIKAGQVLANRPDIVREDYMNELCVLQDDVPSFPDAQAFAIIEEQLGQPLEQLFSSISEGPVAAASLGQVYKAVLRSTGEEVAIKVQRPQVEPVILRDLFIFRTLASFARQRLGCKPELIVDEFGQKLLEELDYVQEARNIQEFCNNFAGEPTVKIPWAGDQQRSTP
ncbi:putative aarF domain-containing protein kinase [Haematococcus lacustris]|uniref:Putative aarF domain-containing protein kinase n=1 Tax=Haematococcus lacustris TaxID=44745 RepID=A0A699Z693_HAELA|nr:putative aarF domain-containing protein kinase [Haematococcus lacustris]